MAGTYYRSCMRRALGAQPQPLGTERLKDCDRSWLFAPVSTCSRDRVIEKHESSAAPAEPHTTPREGCKEPWLHLPADVLDAPLALLPELHVSLDGLLQVQDRGVLHHDHSCNKGHP